MPRKVMGDLIRRIIRDIQYHYKAGESYRTVREIAREFGVSLQSAHKAVGSLCEKGLLFAKPKAGITVLATEVPGETQGLTVLAVSGVPDNEYTDAFVSGIREQLQSVDGNAVVMKAPDHTGNELYLNSLAFADLIEKEMQRHNAAGICVSSLRYSVLPLYHLHTKGIPVVSNLEFEEAPVIPAVTIDLDKALDRAVGFFSKRGKTEILTVSEWDVKNPRLQKLLKLLETHDSSIIVKNVTIRSAEAMQKLHSFFRTFNDRKGVFVLDFVVGRLILPYFPMNGIPLKENLLLFDGEDEKTFYKDEGPVQSAAPSVREQAAQMTEKLMQRIRDGKWKGPVQESI